MNISALWVVVKQKMSVLTQLPETLCEGQFPGSQQKEKSVEANNRLQDTIELLYRVKKKPCMLKVDSEVIKTGC